MQVILDTHIFVWYIEGDQRLSQASRDIIEFSADEVYLSIASLWEIAIKTNLGKLKLNYDFSELENVLKSIDVKLLGITFQDLKVYQDLPLHHRDPFDRLIIAQAQRYNFPLISKDENFKQYVVQLLWD